MTKILFLPGDGIGPEVMKETRKVLDTIIDKYQLDFVVDNAVFGGAAIDQYGHPFPTETEKKCLESDAIMLGAVGHPKFDNAEIRPEQGLLQLRKSLGVYLNIRPMTSYPELFHLSPLKKERIENVNFVIYRELTGGIYFGERGIDPFGNTFDTCTYAEHEIERIIRPAFQKAKDRNNKLHIIDKANVLDTSRLWRKVAKKIALDFPDVELHFLYVDNAAMQMILNPAQFDVIATSNMFGDIISDEASVIAGSIGLLPSASVGNKIGLFEPIHGSYPQATGQNKANPIASILSLAMMFDFLRYEHIATEIREIVDISIQNKIVTEDISKKHAKTCTEVGDYINGMISNANIVVSDDF